MTKTRQWTIFTAVAVVLVLAAGWLLLVKPQSAKVSSLQSQTTAQEASNAQLQSQISSEQAEEKQLPAEQRALQRFATQVPPDASEPTIIRQLSAASQAAGVYLLAITPAAPTAVTATSTSTAGSTPLSSTASSGTLEELPLTLQVAGSYANVESFFLALEELPRALLVTNWTLCPYPTPETGNEDACTPPSVPGNKTLPTNAVGGSMTANVFYSAPSGTSTSPATTLPGTTTTAPSTTTTTPSTTPSTAASTAPSTAPTAAAS